MIMRKSKIFKNNITAIVLFVALGELKKDVDVALANYKRSEIWRVSK